MSKRIGIIGTGVMGTAILKGITESNLMSTDKLYCFDQSAQKLETVKNRYNINTTGSSRELAECSDIIIIAVKPNLVKYVLESFADRMTGEKVVVSIAAGVTLKFLEDVIGKEKKVVRVMPNTPLQVGEGMTLISCNSNVTDCEKLEVSALFKCAGRVEELPENLMNEVVALTSSSPAYVFMFIEAMSDAAVQSGIPRELSYKLAAQAVLGSAKMVLETGKHPGELKDQVCTPAGTTIEAVAVLEKCSFRNAVIEAMNACTRKTREMSKR